jgi:hypothetical protein
MTTRESCVAAKQELGQRRCTYTHGTPSPSDRVGLLGDTTYGQRPWARRTARC